MEDSHNNSNINKLQINDNINNTSTNSSNIIQSFSTNTINENSEKKIIKKISDLFSNICQENTKNFNKENNSITKPFLSISPSISINDYLERLYKYSKMNISTVILILIYIDRICNINKFKLTYYIIHKLILSSMVVAIKYNEDEYYSIKVYAKLGGVTKAEMVFLEYYFVSLINFNLYVKKELFNKYDDYISSADSEEEENGEIEDSPENSENNDINKNNNINNDV
jgi:hypothetical protein